VNACPGCSAEQPDGARFCADCGTALAAPACSECGAELLPGARFCSTCGTAQSVPGAARLPEPVASRRITSVLFGDLVGFTALSEKRDDEETRELLTRYFDSCRQIISRYGGTVEKFIGDAVMAVWGVPTAHEDDAERAVRAGLELVAMTSAMVDDATGHELAMRVGIVTGEVAVTIGAEQQGMVAGNAVNTASRVQTVAEPGQVWVDESTRLLTTSAITYLDRGSHELKGRTDPVPLWSVQAVVAAIGGAQRADGLEAPLVGRERELRLVKELFHAAAETGQPRLMVMVGDPGAGKSRIGWEFEKYVDGLTANVRWHSGRCVAYGEGLAFFALAEAIRPRLRALVADHDGGTEESAQEQEHLLELGLRTYVPDPEERSWMRPRLGALLGVTSVGTFPREDLFSAWTSFLERVGAGEQPVVLLIDDAHHADDGLLLFIEHLLAAATFPVFVVLLARPGLIEEHPHLATNRRATLSHLDALSDAEIATLLGGLVVGLPDEVRATLVARSQGMPLFAVETVRSLIDRDLVVPRGGQYVLADPDALDVDSIGAPSSLQGLIAARLDALQPQQRRLVERASVIGNSFTREEIVELCPDLDDPERTLTALVRLQILSQLSSRFSAEFGQYQFVQSVVRQVAYARLSLRDRRAIHLAVAAQTEAMDDAVGDLAPIIAQHYLNAARALPTEADVPELEQRAIVQLERAASRARALGAVSDAANHLSAALDLAHEQATRARVESALAWALVDSGQRERALEHAATAVRACDDLGDPVAAGLAAAAQGTALAYQGDNAGALSVVEPRWKALLRAPGAEIGQLALSRVIVTASSRLGETRRDVLDHRIQIAERVGDLEELADSLAALANEYSGLGASGTGIILLSAAADMARAEHLPSVLARCLTNLTVEYTQVDLAKGIATGMEAVEVAARVGTAIWRDYAGVNLSLAKLAAGRWDELDLVVSEETRSINTKVLDDAVIGVIRVARGESFETFWHDAAATESDDPSDLAWIHFAEAQEGMASGRNDLALERAVRATELMLGLSGLSDDFHHMWPVAMDLALLVGDDRTVSRLLEMVEHAASQWKVPPSVQAHRARFTGLLASRQDPDLAEQWLGRAVAAFDSWGSPHYRARAQAELGRLLESRGRVDDAAPLLQSAVATLSELRAVAWLAELGLRTTAVPG
jgi:class 3 adenylate cyclase/tetratricopeptide (TPR) repeat protein